MTEQIPDTPEVDRIYCLYGKVSHHCFNIEVCCGMLLRGPEWRKNHTLATLTPEIIDSISEQLNRSTLGQLIRKINEHYPLSKDEEQYLEEVLRKRNYVAHKFFGTYGKRMYVPETWAEMIKELIELLGFFEEASSHFAKWSGINDI